MQNKPSKNMKRAIHPIPIYIQQALKNNKLIVKYKSRPAYQQNDYIGWITRAKKPITQEKRLAQMLEELQKGDVYMKMPYKPNKN